MLTTIIQLLIGGLLLGGIYALAAFGLSISFGVLNILNIAHGEFLMLGALLAFGAFAYLGLSPFFSAFLVIPIFMAVGIIFYRVLLNPIVDKPPHELLIASILVTLGVSLVIEDVTLFTWERSVVAINYSLSPISLGGVVISSLRLLFLIVITILTIALHFYIKKTYVGKAIRAITQDRDGAKIIGINLTRISPIAFGIGAALAAMAGAFYVTIFTVSPVIGIPLSVKFLCIVVLGGLGSLVGSLVGGLILGITETLTGYFIGADWSLTIAFLLLILILIFRPEGLLGRRYK